MVLKRQYCMIDRPDIMSGLFFVYRLYSKNAFWFLQCIFLEAITKLINFHINKEVVAWNYKADIKERCTDSKGGF